MKKPIIAFLSMFIIVSGAIVTCAQDTISPEKAALIKELIAATKSKESFNEITTNLITFQQGQTKQMVANLIDKDKTLSPSARAQAKEMATETVDRILIRTREFFSKQFDFDQFVDQVYLPVYDKHFTETELRDMLAFYATPTGQKTIKVLPQLTMDTVVAVSQHLLPRFQEFIQQTVDEEMAALKQKLIKKRSQRAT